jgi:hypothetical protein
MSDQLPALYQDLMNQTPQDSLPIPLAVYLVITKEKAHQIPHNRLWLIYN